MPEIVPHNQRHAQLFQKDVSRITEKGESFAFQRAGDIPFGRYEKVFYDTDTEEIYAKRQSALDQIANGTAKMAGTFTTSFLEGTVGIVNGIGEWMNSGKFSSFYDNSFNRNLDELNKSLEDALPNYYTHAEKDAEWWSPTNVFSANFLGDKVLKNLGYSFGALAGGMGWGAALKSIGLTNKLIRAGQGLRTVEAVEATMANTPRLQQFGAVNKTLNSLWQSSKNVAGVALSNSERAIISSMGMMGEATIEAYQASNNFRSKLIDDYKNIYGFAPTGEDLEEINAYANQVGNTTFGANALLLTLTNYVQLPKILGSSKTLEKRMINSIEKEGFSVTDKFISEAPSRGNVLSPVFSKLGKVGKGVDKYVLGPGRLTFSVGEAFEEGMQYAIEKGSEDYFDRAYKNREELSGFLDGVGGVLGSIFTEGVRKALTDKEGLESMLIGGVSGALQKIKGNISERGVFGEGGVYGKNTQLALDALNKTNIKQVLQDGVKYAGIALESQKLRQEAIDNNDTFSEKDYEKDFTLSYIMPRVKYGKVDSVKQEVGYYREQAMSDSGFQELQGSGVVLPGETRERFLERLLSIENTADDVNKVYTMLEEKYSAMRDEEGKFMYTPDIIDRLAYNSAKISDYDKRFLELSTKLQKDGVDPSDIISAITGTDGYKKGNVKEAISDKSVKEAIDNKSAEIIENNLIEPDSKIQDVLDLTRLLVTRQAYINDYNSIKTNPLEYKDVTPSSLEDRPTVPSEEDDEDKETVTIKTKTGEKNIEVGTEYFIGKGVDYETEGIEAPVNVWSLTILGKNEDGTIKIRDNKGQVRDVAPSVLEEYKIAKSSTVRSNTTANYFYNHRDVIFEYNFGKDKGGKKPGRLEYDNGNLFFVYKDDKGKIKRKKLERKHFVAQPIPSEYGNTYEEFRKTYIEKTEQKYNYTPEEKEIRGAYESLSKYANARIEKIGNIKATPEQLSSEQEYMNDEEAKKAETLAGNRDARLGIITELETETRTRLEQVNKKLEAKKKELEGIQQDLDKIGDEVKVAEPRTKREKAIEAKYPELSRQNIRFGKVLSSTSKAISKLSGMKEDVENDITKLTAERDELEFNLSYFSDFAQNLDELPENSGEFLKELKEQVGWLEELVKETGREINVFSDMLKTIDKAIKDFVSLLQSSMQKFDEDYPQYMKDSFERMKENPIFSEVKNLKEYLADYAMLQDLQKEISVNEGQLKTAENEINKLYEQVNELGSEYNAKKQILDRFQAVANEYNKRKAEEEKIAKDEKLQAEVLGTAYEGVQIIPFEKEYDPVSKKSNEIIPRATMGVMRGKPHQVRANTFGFNLNKFENRNNIRGVYVTSKNEDQILPGLTDRLRMDEAGQINEDIDKDSIIAMVMVEEDNEGNVRLVGEDGKPIPEGVDQLDAAIYQVFPDGELKWGAEYNNESMFRKDTPDEVKQSVTKQYKEWRKSVLENPSIDERHEIEASFGMIEETRDADGNIIYDTQTSVEDANLITTDDLESKQLINIPNLNTTVTQGTVSFKTPLGRVFLELPNGLVRLQNRKHTAKEAETIFQAILKYAKNMLDPEKGTKHPESERVLNWLQSVVYWGIPKDQEGNEKPAGYNSIFFEKDEETGKLMLTLSGKGKDYAFTPTTLEDNRESLIMLISNMYNNINRSMSQNLNEPYEEILSISNDGKITSRMWKNYQSYLLSKTTPDGNVRGGKELPLSTLMRPVAGPEDINRTNIYFYTTDTADDFVIPIVEKKKAVTAKAKVLTPGAPKAAPKSEVEKFYVSKDVIEKINNLIIEEELVKGNYSYYPSDEAAKNDEGIVITKSNVKDAIKANEEIGDAIYDNKTNDIVGVPDPIIKLKTSDISYIEVFGAKDLVDIINDPKEDPSDRKLAEEKYNELVKKIGGKLTTPSKPAPVSDEETFKIGEEEEEVPAGQYVLDGDTVNTYTSPQGKKILFRASKNANPSNLDKTILIVKGGDVDEVIAKIKEAGKDPADTIRKTIYNNIAPQLEQEAQDDDTFTISETVVDNAEKQTGKKISNSVLSALNKKIKGLNDKALRAVLKEDLKKFQPENWSEVEGFLKRAFPNIPVYRVKNLIQATNGRQAWGMFKDGAIYIYENAEVGTTYHEVFHAVWRMVTDSSERTAIIDEMRARSGKFFDRSSLADVSYKEATEDQLEEKLAEEFRDYIQFKKIPQKPAKGRPFILKLFADLATMIREFFLGPQSGSKVEEMFSKIGRGYYKSYIPFQNELSFAKQGVIDIEEAFADSDAALSLAGINDRERADIINHMTYLTLAKIIKTDDSLFAIEETNKKELYDLLKEQVLQTVAKKIQAAPELVKEGEATQEQADEIMSTALQLMQNIDDQWNTIVERHQEYLKSYSIEFDENDNVNLRDENNSGRETYQDATKIDNFRKTNSAIKLLLSTVPEVDSEGNIIPSSIGGATLIPVGQVYISLMNNLHNSQSVEEMVNRLRIMATDDVNYRTLYKRVTKRDWKDAGVDLSNIKNQHTLQLLSAFWNTFKKQSPDVKNVFILDNGEVVVGEANLSTAAQQLRSKYVSSIVLKARSNEGFFKYDEKEKVFKGNPDKVREYDLNNFPAMIKFLDKLGISFNLSDVGKMNRSQKNMFKEAVAGIKESISKTEKIATFSGKVLNIDKRLFQLGLVKAAIDNPEFSSTFYNVSGERTQTFIGTNAVSDLSDFIKSLPSFNKDTVGGSRYNYLLKDSFAKGSNLLSRMFTSSGTPKEGSEDLLTVGYVGGIVNEQKGKRKESSKLNYKERLIQEVNLNLAGWYLNLVPGDASIEHMIKMGNAISTSSVSRGMDDINEIFKQYFISELELVREDRPVAEGRNSKEMRFFRDILGSELHDKVVNAKGSAESVYEANKVRISEKLEKFIEKDMEKFQSTLSQYGILYQDELGYQFDSVGLPSNLSKKELEKHLKMLTVNYMIANIEMHKLLYSDPYQYEDELKRIKSFNSPRQAIINNSPKMNAVLNDIWNKGYKPGDIGHTKFTQDYFRSATHSDVIGTIDLPNYTKFKETDGSGVISMKSYRQFRIRAGNWNDNEESQYRHDIAYEKLVKSGASEEEIAKFEKNNPGVQSAYTPIKPIVSGAKLDERGLPANVNNIVLDKFALYPLSYRISRELNKESNSIKLYDKMQREDIDYIVFNSGRKVGAERPHPTYKDGVFNDDPYKGIINVPFSIMSIQAEVPSKETSTVTRGSQITKLITLDFMEAGVPVDFVIKNKKGEEVTDFNERYKAWYTLDLDQQLAQSELFKEIKNNQELLNALIEEGYRSTLNRLGIKETVTKQGRKFEITDFSKATQTLRDEILKREVNDNISAALAAFLDGKSVLEATPAYQQVRNIIYSIADKEFISPKISGGMKVQIPSTLFESGARKVKDGLYESDILKFYEKDGKRVAEVMLGRWFDTDMSDEELLDYLNNTEEGQKILSGIGYRIPTQKQNSVDVIVVKKFLPKEFGDSVVIPAALVQKVGSDFDIDKLSVYLKNVYIKNGKPKLVPYLGTGEQAINKFRELYDQGEFLTEEEMKELDRYISEEEVLLQDIAEESASGKLMASIVGKLFSEEELVQEFTKGIRSKDQIINKLYKKSLENAYIQSMENLVTHPKNYENLIKPNSADQLKGLAEFIAEKTVGSTFDYKNVGNMLDRTFMSRLRHAFVTGKYAIGIAAVNQTNHSLNQRQPIYIDKSRLSLLSDDDKFWIGDANIKFKDYNRITVDGKVVPTLSMIKNKAGENISDIIGMFIDGYVDISKGPWIMELGATPNVASTWLFLVKLGVPINTVAYFMNQPIVRDYLRTIESAGYSWLFIDQFVEAMAYKYGQDISETELNKKLATFTIPSETTLKNNVGKKSSDLTVQEKAEQFLMLKEFLKYAKMAEQMFIVTQGSNYDTSTFNDPYLVFKKQMQQEKAQNTIINSVETLLENSFIGTLAYSVNNIRDAFAEIIKSDKKNIRNVIQKVLMPYIGMSDREFVKIAQKAVNDLFDWAVQNDQKLNLMIQDILINDGGVGSEVLEFVTEVKKDPSHPLYNNQIINTLVVDPSKRSSKEGVNNLKIEMGDTRVYDQNNVIYAFRELRDHLEGESSPLYERIKTLAILQSGLSSSPISFTSLIPYEDFESIYNKTLVRLENIPNLDQFYKLGVFQRNNWNNDDVTPYLRAKLIETKEGRKHYNPSMKFLPDSVKEAIANDDIPPVMTLSLYNRESASDYIVYTWEKELDILTDEEKRTNPPSSYTKMIIEKKAQMRKAGDYSFINKGLFRKVVDNYGTPLLHTDYKGTPYFVYKAINAWGDSFRANEFWDVDHKSVIDNGFIKVEDVDNNVIITKFLADKKVKPAQKKDIGTVPKGIQMTGPNVGKIEAGTKTATIRSQRQADEIGIPVGQTEVRYIGSKLYNVTNRGLLTIAEAGGKAAMLKADGVKSENELMYQQTKDWVNGKGKLYVYDIAPAVSTTAAKITSLANQPEFNKLPGKSATPTMTYAGIGSRQTPPQVIKQMTEVAKELASKGYTLNTGVTFGGKEEGADAAFSRGATKKNLFSPEKQGSRAKEQTIAKEVHPNPGALSQGALKLMARNTNQVFGDNLDTPVDFVLFWAKETKGIRPEGGTGQAVEMARRKGIPTINMADANWKEQLNTALTRKPQPVIDSSKKINIYAGTGENVELSNFANRAFEIKPGQLPTKLSPIKLDFKFNSVEQAFQYYKALLQQVNYVSGGVGITDQQAKYNLDIKNKLKSVKTGAGAKSLGQQLKLSADTIKEWDSISSSIMKELLKQSFIQNPSALQTLLATGNAELTHTQDKSKWGKEFPKLLMEVRQELREAKPSINNKNVVNALKKTNTIDKKCNS